MHGVINVPVLGCSLTETLELEDMGMNESLVIGLHEEVLEMMDTVQFRVSCCWYHTPTLLHM